MSWMLGIFPSKILAKSADIKDVHCSIAAGN